MLPLSTRDWDDFFLDCKYREELQNKPSQPCTEELKQCQRHVPKTQSSENGLQTELDANKLSIKKNIVIDHTILKKGTIWLPYSTKKITDLKFSFK